jgi:hypothetical protein
MKNMVYEYKVNRRGTALIKFLMLQDAGMTLMFYVRFKLS